MLITYDRILSVKKTLEGLCEKPLMPRDAISLSRLIKKVNEELTFFEQQRLKLCEQYGKFDEKEGCFIFGEDNKNKFADELRELLLTEFEVGERLTVRLRDTADIDARTIYELDFLISFDLQEG